MSEGGFSQGSEPFLRDDEAVCPVTGYTYLAALGTSPYIEEPRLILDPSCDGDAIGRNLHTDSESRKFSAMNA